MTTDLSSLIERIEKSEGADRDVDLLVDLFARPDQWAQDCHDAPSSVPTQWCDDDELPRYTASIDAAMSLVPVGSHCGMGYDSPREGETVGRAWAWVLCKVNGKWEDTPIDWRGHRPPSIALALCAAALKARNPSHEG